MKGQEICIEFSCDVCRAGVIIKEPLVKPKPEIGSGVLTSIDPQSLEDSHIGLRLGEEADLIAQNCPAPQMFFRKHNCSMNHKFGFFAKPLLPDWRSVCRVVVVLVCRVFHFLFCRWLECRVF